MNHYDRKHIAKQLYISGGCAHASNRCDLNTRFGKRDLIESILEHLGLAKGSTVLDVCCGSGQHLEQYACITGTSGNAIGCDFSQDAVIATRERGLDAFVSDASCLPLPSAFADALSCNYAIYYIDIFQDALYEWKRVLKDGGRLVITGPAPDTNAELYKFHHQATGYEPEVADQMALGFIDTIVAKNLSSESFCNLGLETFVNPISFPDAESFLDYWTSTTLFARCNSAERCQGERILKNHDMPVTVTKKTSILHATFSAQP